jgi:hypothetical protein
MRDVTSHNFGLLIAYVLPGVTTLWGASYFSPTVRVWLGSAPADAPTVGGFLYLTVAAIAAGLIASTVRWAVIDTLHHLTGIPRPKWDFSHFADKTAAFDVLCEIHYRYYQFYGNCLTSLAFAYVARRTALGLGFLSFGWEDLGVLLIECLLFAGSRDTFRKYHERLEMMLGGRGATVTRDGTNDGSANRSPDRAQEPSQSEKPSLRTASRTESSSRFGAGQIGHEFSHCHTQGDRQALDVDE